MTRLLLGSFIAAVAVFMWGFVFYAASPAMSKVVKGTPDDAAAQAAIRDHFPESGTYFVPSPDLPEDQLNTLHQAGPLALINVRSEGGPVMDPMVLTWGFIHEWIVCFLLGWLLLRASLDSYGERVMFLTVAGFTAALFIDYGGAIWWGIDRGFALMNLFYNTVAWLVAGLVLAWKPGAEA